ncbi:MULTISPECIES: SOS response-associated peptidase family protein [unclassified Mesorhizobium]|uniref:SOS response-associated peptidase family protein n=1 Tax=unclassified Mesorhizobium TaxID=325217 RepID=UPI000FCBD03E|nr:MULTISPECIES: SOS response-associated peptidase family protein [unclassified Mesorhizobium]RUV50027.1 SOS response-associated peptidase [Mesorhizobium sp. M5C.F.Ca.IN.020.29.1.1]RWK47578.1 MAG: SOS response-associated peptidase [Mesorhizobium sp.]TIM84299.1 MAG: SOS response-associated peptidase [Mesorhizobium sp.]TIP39428.1 MAG: SOS response-associated peptidase [Mesorhizobium sp.]
MCNAYEQHVKWVEYCKMMQALELGIPTQQSELDLPESDDIRINDMAPVMRAAGNGIELVPMNFSFPPSGPKGGPVFNFRSEGRNFANSNRCLIPASAFFEFTGAKYPKTKHRFTLNGAPFMVIAGIWREGQGNHPSAFTTLTTEPGPDIAPFHNRQIVVLQPSNWAAWLFLTKPEKELLKALPGGSLDVETVRKGSE